MSYELKPGQGSIFKNNRKEKETHPDYNGKIKTLDGKEWELSLWVKKSEKGSFFSVSVKEPYRAVLVSNPIDTATMKPNPLNRLEQDDLPF